MKNIAVVCGGDSGEFEISLQSGQVVADALDPAKFNPYLILIHNGEWYHLTAKGERIGIDKNDFSLPLPRGKVFFDAVFNAIHGIPGEDGSFTGYLDMIGMPYTSSGQVATTLTFNKDFCKRVVESYGVGVALSVNLRKGEQTDTDEILAQTGLPVFVKPNNSGSSVGVTKVKDKSSLLPAIEFAFEHGDEVLVETFIEGIELGCSVMQTKSRGLLVLPLTEIVSKTEFFDYAAKYKGMADEITPARIESKYETQVSHTAAYLYRKLGCAGFVRFDFILHPEHGLIFLEVNTVPGLSPASILPQQAEVMGISLQELFGLALENVLDE